MLTTTSTFDNAIKENGREFYVRATIGATTFDYSNIVSFSVEESVATDELQLGVAFCASMELEINNQDGHLDSVTFENSQVRLETGIKTTAGVEYVALGEFNVDNSSKKSKNIMIKGYDNMIKAEIPFVDNLTYPATLAQIAQAACTQAGLILLSTNFNNSTYQVSQKFYSDGVTCREVLAYVAGASGGFARCNRDGKIEIVWVANTTINIQPENYINLSMKELKAGPINRLIISKNDGVITGDHFSIEDNTSITANGEYAITIKDNPLLVDNMEGALNTIFNQINGLAFYPYDLTWQGNPALQALDKIKVTNEVGTVFDTLITSQKLIYAGGLKCEMKCASKSNTARKYSREGSISKKLRYAEITLDKQAAEIALKASSEEVQGINQRLSQAEINLQPENIAFKVQYSNLYTKENKKELLNGAIQVARSGLSINPLEFYNFTNGTIFNNNQLVSLDFGVIEDRTYVPDLAIVNNNLYTYILITEAIDGMEQRLASAEVKIADDSIISTVIGSVEYTGDMDNINNAIQFAQNTANSKADPSYVDNAESNAKNYADAVAQAKSSLVEIAAKAYADNIVTAEELARIQDAQAKLNEAKAYAESQSSTAETNANNYTDAKKAEIDTSINILVGRVTTAEEKITPEAITQTVTESNTYKSYNLVPNKSAITTVRSGLSINPLESYNFVSGTIFNANELVSVDMGISNLVYTTDLQIANGELVTFDKPADRIETAEGQIAVQAGKIALVVKEDGTVDGQSLVAAINISPTKIEQTALNIDFSGYVTFLSLTEQGSTSINGGNIITNTLSFNSLADKPFIPTQYTDKEALAAWEASGYATYIDGTGAYIGNIKANQLLIGGANGSISFNNLVDKPFIPSSAADVGAISSTYIDANGVFTPQVYATNINVSNGLISANKINVSELQTQITTVGKFISFSNSGSYVNGIGTMTGGTYAGYLGLVASLGVYLNTDNVYTSTGRVATREWVTNTVSGGGIYAKFK